MPAPAGPKVQIFGLVDSRPTQAAQRFFKERRANVTFVDLRRKPIAPGELRRFVERLGAAALLDTAGRQYNELGLAYMRLDDDEIVARLLANNGLLKLPLVRLGNAFTAGPADVDMEGLAGGREVLTTAPSASPADPGGSLRLPHTRDHPLRGVIKVSGQPIPL